MQPKWFKQFRKRHAFRARRDGFFGGNFLFRISEFRRRRKDMFISQTTDFHFANYRFSFRKLQILISQTTDSPFANYRFPFRKLQISISQTTDFHFVSSHFVSQTTVSPIHHRYIWEHWNHSRRTLLPVWKEWALSEERWFNYDGAEICELVGLNILHKLSSAYPDGSTETSGWRCLKIRDKIR